MASNIAARRFKKALRRKAVVAEKQKAGRLEATLPARVSRALALPIQHCLLQQCAFEQGIGTLVVARGATPSLVTVGTFLLDVYCLGVKDVLSRSLGPDDLGYFRESLEVVSPVISVEPAYAAKLLRDLVAWAESIGFAPHKDFAAVSQLLADVDPEACDASFQFGYEGKPLYVPGPTETPALVRSRIELLRKRFGDDGFESLTAA